MKTKGFAIAILLALTMPASAEDMASANYFLPGCKGFVEKKKTLASSEALCAGFVTGLAFGISGRDSCQPERVTNNQVVAVVIKYIEARPERMHEQFGDLAIEALAAAWPCK
jgi:hypothetical protein